MRLNRALFPLLALVGISFAQDTNFSAGPQYLVTTSSPMLLRPIVTPSLSLGEAQPVAVTVSASETTAEQFGPSPVKPSDSFLGIVYWGEHKPAEIVNRRMDTPSMTPSETAGYMNAIASQSAAAPITASAEATAVPSGSAVVELTGTQPRPDLPASILDVGVTGMTDARSLLARGYGLPLGDVAAYWKSHKRTAPRVFTNADVVRPRG